MANYTGDNAADHNGTAVTERTGTASSDTVAAGSVVMWKNTGAGAHVVTITTAQTDDGLAVADQTISLAAGQIKVGRVPADWGDTNDRCAVAIDGTATEVKYYVLGGV